MHQQVGQVHKLANGAAAIELAAIDCRDASAVIATIFKAFKRFDQ